MLPNILLDQSVFSKTNLINGDPCADVTGADKMEAFLKCQPKLLKIYLALAEMYMEEVALVMDEDYSLISENMDNGSFVLNFS